ncbi:unnamed protein product [Linum trigynum]|uniref:Uncharacterized protein n=1 Tax=Linum trigynum TaxID=586398 RepID=A0AAV2DGM1_9ROSI
MLSPDTRQWRYQRRSERPPKSGCSTSEERVTAVLLTARQAERRRLLPDPLPFSSSSNFQSKAAKIYSPMLGLLLNQTHRQ